MNSGIDIDQLIIFHLAFDILFDVGANGSTNHLYIYTFSLIYTVSYTHCKPHKAGTSPTKIESEYTLSL